MASIYTYPEIGGLSNEDLFIVTDVSNDNSTKTLAAEDLKAFVMGDEVLSFEGNTGTGAINLESEEFAIVGAANQIQTSASGDILTVALTENVSIAGVVTVGVNLALPGVVPLNFANDQAAAAGGVPIGGLYHNNGGQLHIRLT